MKKHFTEEMSASIIDSHQRHVIPCSITSKLFFVILNFMEDL